MGGGAPVRRSPGPSLSTRPGLRLVHMPSEPSGSQRSPAVSSGRSFAQVAGAILRKKARGQNPDKDEVPGSSPGRPTTTPWPAETLVIYVSGTGPDGRIAHEERI